MSPSSHNKIVSPKYHGCRIQARITNALFFLLQHRFLPCENKSKAVEQVKSDFNKVSGKGGECNKTSVYSPKRRRRAGAILHLECGNPANGVTSSAS